MDRLAARPVVSEAAGVSEDAELGAFLRGKGIHTAEPEQWRAEGAGTSTIRAGPGKSRAA